MGAGSRIIELEQELMKVWVLGHWDVFGMPFELCKKEILSKIRQYFKNKKHVIFKMNYEDLTEIENLLENIKIGKTNILSIVKEVNIEVEEAGGAHKVTFDGSAYVYPDPLFSE